MTTYKLSITTLFAATAWLVAPAAAQDAGHDHSEAPDHIAVQLEATGEAGIAGTALIAAAGSETELVLELDGADPEVELSALLYAGSCADPGELRVDLGPLSVESSGAVYERASLTETIETIAAPPASLHLQNGDGVVACGEIQGDELVAPE